MSDRRNWNVINQLRFEIGLTSRLMLISYRTYFIFFLVNTPFFVVINSFLKLHRANLQFIILSWLIIFSMPCNQELSAALENIDGKTYQKITGSAPKEKN